MKAKHTEALKLALEALKQIDEAMPFPVAKLAQAALREALAQQALDKMAENAREVGLDYEPAQQEPEEWLTGCPECGMDSCECDSGTWNPQAREPEQPAQTDWEAVAADQAMTIALLKAELQEFAEKQADAVEVALTESGWVWDGDQWQRPPHTWAGLTDEEVKECFDSVPTQDCQNYEHWRSLCARNIEAKLKERNA